MLINTTKISTTPANLTINLISHNNNKNKIFENGDKNCYKNSVINKIIDNDVMKVLANVQYNINQSDNHTIKQNDKNVLSVKDENNVCDISLMSIMKRSNSDHCNCGQYGQLESVNKQIETSKTNDVTDSLYDEDDDVDNGIGMYLNVVEFNRCEEEKTITELVHATRECSRKQTGQNKRMRVAFGLILRLVLPLANGVVRGIQGIRDARFLHILRGIASSKHAITNLMAFAANMISMNLSSVHVSHRIEPILKILKIRKSEDGVESLPDSLVTSKTPSTPSTSCITPSTPKTAITCLPFIREPNGCTVDADVPKCCTLNVLAEPPPGMPIRADIVFIHGLHGSLVNTWKQGLWENDRQPVKFERPPKPPVRPPKRPRHSRTHLIHSHHKLKRARFAHHRCHVGGESREELSDFHDSITNDGNESDFSFVCGEPRDVEICDGVEYSFPTFRLRMNDGGRLLQAELESMLLEDNNEASLDKNSNESKEKAKSKNRVKRSSTKDMEYKPENYSKCWPGDWLPLDCPGVRVLACNYTTDQYLWRPLWKKKEKRTNLTQRSREMAELLIQARVGYGHPIIWVGHSKGGLFVKQIIVDAWESGRPLMAPFWRSSRGVFFYSVPHRGSHLASIKAPLLTRSVELIDIEKNSKYLLDLHRRFASLYHLGHLKVEVFSFVETALTLMSVLYLRIVGVDSADPGIGDVCGIRLDHREICKPRSRECILYKELVKMINKVC